MRKSEGKADAAQQIMKKYDLDAEQTDAILELKIYRLARLEKAHTIPGHSCSYRPAS